MSTDAENLSTIGLVLAEIFGWIYRFLLYCSKKCTYNPRYPYGYWTDLNLICTECSLSLIHI